MSLCDILSPTLIKENIIPIAIDCLKSADCEYATGVMNNFGSLTPYLSNHEVERIVEDLVKHFGSDNWRHKCRIVEALKKICVIPDLLTDKIIKIIVELANDRIDAVRKSVVDLVVEIIRKD